MMLVRRTMLMAGIAWALAGCGGKEPPPPPPPGIVELTITAAPNVNPDKAGRASPVNVTVYQLTSRSAFDTADFFQLNDPKLLAADQRGRDQILLAPGEKKALTLQFQEGVHYIAIAGAFRSIDKATWRAVVEVPPHGTTKLTAQLAGITVTLKPGG